MFVEITAGDDIKLDEYIIVIEYINKILRD